MKLKSFPPCALDTPFSHEKWSEKNKNGSLQVIFGLTMTTCAQQLEMCHKTSKRLADAKNHKNVPFGLLSLNSGLICAAHRKSVNFWHCPSPSYPFHSLMKLPHFNYPHTQPLTK